MKVFAYRVTDQVLFACSDAHAALREFAQDGALAEAWLWFAHDGAPLRLEQDARLQRSLRPWASCSSCHLAQVLPYVQRLQDDPSGAALSALRQIFGAQSAGDQGTGCHA